MEKKLYKVQWIHQVSGAVVSQYAFAENAKIVEDEYTGILSIAPCDFVEFPEDPTA